MLGLLTGVLVLGATAWNADATPPRSKDSCREPHPCGPHWPAGLKGPFALKEVRNVQVRAHDGVLLDGWVASPAVPNGVRTPTILTDSPYFDSAVPATVYRNPSSEPLPIVGETGSGPTGTGRGYWNDGEMSSAHRIHSLGFPLIRLIRSGYTVVFFSVRGTGSSGGCFSFGGRDEQRDQVTLVDWVAQQAWSNGRVGMGGLSYMSYTAWQAAVQAPSALKTVVTAGDVVDLYQFAFTPQGAQNPVNDEFAVEYDAEMALVSGAMSGRTQFLARQTCPHGGMAAQETAAMATGDRNAPYWKERNLSLRLPSVRAAVLDTGGYLDFGGHVFQTDTVWGSLTRRTPKLQVRGWWAHEFPGPEDSVKTKLDLPSGTVSWESVVLGWFDYWLKGIGPAPLPARVLHQDQQLGWHEARDWSPASTSKELLHLSGGQLTRDARSGSTSFLSAPSPQDAGGMNGGVEPALCPEGPNAVMSRTYLTKPVTSRTLIAGNPMAYLRLSSDKPDAMVTTSLFDIGPGFSCTGPTYTDAQWISSGSADLGFFNSPFVARPFPVNAPRWVRVDLTDVTYTLAPGHRLALTLSHGSVTGAGTRAAPTITVLGASHLVVAVSGGTLGGKRPTLRYPPRPFTPRHYRD
ncbi:MAG TPA: CocE/NonD family hydrolase [Mycobacteriales bacterium]|nr:CocE/NonD family hydrolase [Mycobacteriales bacterium]